MKKLFIISIILLAMIIGLAACSAKPGSEDGIYSPATKGSMSDPASGDHSGDPSGDSNDNPGIPAGQLTAAEWNDNINFDKWLALMSTDQEGKTGIYGSFLTKWKLDTQNRVAVNVLKEELPVSGATVKVYKEDTLLYSAVTDAKGKAYLFLKNVAENDTLKIQVITGGVTEEKQIIYQKGMPEVTVTVGESSAKLNKLEIMFVVDTTGSMGDELNYLKSEINDVISRVKQSNPDTDITVALLFYRDIGDEYVTRYFDFSADINAVKSNISAQFAGGGGDFPEAVHTALSEAVSKQWSSGNSTKLLIHVLDAPPHYEQEIMDAYVNSIYIAAQKGIRMIPIASSGIDRDTEYLLRNEAILTGGTYVFLTNESGIGNPHLEPSIDGYVVEYLNALLVRVINELHTGIHVPPTPYGQQ